MKNIMNANVYIFHLKKVEEQELFSSMFWPTSGQISQCPSILHSDIYLFFFILPILCIVPSIVQSERETIMYWKTIL